MQKLKLRINEENEIGFKVNIESSEPGMAKPNIRFVITEAQTGRGWTFKANKEDDDVKITIPSMKGIVKEGRQYEGKLEVILGARYFAPTEVDVNFVEPLKVEATIVTAVSKKREEIKEDLTLKEAYEDPDGEPIEEVYDFSMDDEEEGFLVESTIINQEDGTQKRTEKKIQYSDLSGKQKKEAHKIFLGECKKLNIEDPQKEIKEGSDYTKKRFKALMAKAVKAIAAKE